MRVKSKIKSLILLFVAFVLSAVFGVFSLNLGVKNVSGASTPADFDISGMSLRYTESGAEKAVRFHVTMTEETYNATIAKGAESGVLIIPKSLLQGNLTLSTELAVNCMFDAETWGENEEGLYEARAVLTDIPEKNYGTKLAVVAYYTLNGETTYSEKYDNGSLAAVAVMEKEAYPDKALPYKTPTPLFKPLILLRAVLQTARASTSTFSAKNGRATLPIIGTLVRWKAARKKKAL